MAQAKWMWHEETGRLIMSGSKRGHKLKSSTAETKVPQVSIVATTLLDKSKTDRKITLEDIKAVAISLINEDSVLSMNKRVTVLFDQCYRTDQMNTLLWASLLYYDALEHHKEAISYNSNLCTTGGVGDVAKKALREAKKKLCHSQTSLGQGYSHFILGLEHWRSHHSKGGRSRASNTHADQMFYETLYEFVMLCVWICFGYKNWHVIQSEIGEVFRTGAFNRDYESTARVEESVKIEGLGTISKQSDEYIAYRVLFDRPPVGSLRFLRSPAVMNILPSPKDKAHSPRTIHCSTDLMIKKECFPEQLGIIGDSLSDYEPQTLQRIEKSLEESTSSSAVDGINCNIEENDTTTVADDNDLSS